VSRQQSGGSPYRAEHRHNADTARRAETGARHAGLGTGAVRRLLQIVVMAVLLTTAGMAVEAASASAQKADVLVVSRDFLEESRWRADLISDFQTLGYTVAESPVVPAGLSRTSYKSVWVILEQQSLAAKEKGPLLAPGEEEALERYVQEGGRLYLNGEALSCCAEIDRADERIARTVLKDQAITVGEWDWRHQRADFDSATKDGATEQPHHLVQIPGWPPSSINGIDQLSGGHALAFAEGTPSGAVFDEGDMKNHEGRLLISMTSAYLEPNGRSAEEGKQVLEMVENFEDFLMNTTDRDRLPGDNVATAGNVLVVTSEAPTNLKAGLDAAAVLRSLHYRVTLSVAPSISLAKVRPSTTGETVDTWKMPKLTDYSSVWMLAEGSPAVQGENREKIMRYVARGGSLYLGGDHVTPPSNAADQDILRYLLKNEQISIANSISGGAMQFATGALDGIAEHPSRLGSMPIHETGEIYGLAPQNVLATDGESVTAAAFDEADMNSRRGRLVIYPDDWTQAEPDPITRAAFVQNIEDFLEVTPERIAPRTPEDVGLGDSYASGQGSGEYMPGTDGEGGCFHALHGYIERIAEDDHMSFTNRACSGAQIYELWEPGKHESQLSVVGQDTRAITLTVGGDDMGFAGVLKSCLLPHGSIPGTHIPRIIFSEGCTNSLQDPAQQAMTWLRHGRKAGTYTRPGGDKAHNLNYQPSLQQLYETILYQAPGAELVVIGYPHLFESAVPASEAFSCEVEPFTETSYGLKVKGSDIPWINQTTDEVDLLISRAVNATREATHRQIRFANPQGAFYDHGLCDKGTSYINGLTFEPEFIFSTNWKRDLEKLLLNRQPESFHPTAEGQEALRALIEEVAQEF
jgi:GDSL-like Lipase/Acylhydrolase family